MIKKQGRIALRRMGSDRNVNVLIFVPIYIAYERSLFKDDKDSIIKNS